MKGKKSGVLAFTALVVGVVAVTTFLGTRSTFTPSQREGPPMLVESGQGPVVWIATRQMEEKSRSVGWGRHSTGRWIQDRYYHLMIEAHDPRTTERIWKKTLATVSDRGDKSQVVNAGPVRLLGMEDGIVWAWAHDQLLALSTADASVVADRKRMEQANPELAGLFPADLNFYAWYGGLIVTLADARRMKITLPDYRAEPFSLPEAERQAFDYAASMSHTYWGGAFKTEDFGVRHTTADNNWVGLFSESEARDAENDEFGDHYAGSEWIDNEGKNARRTFWKSAESGRTKEFSEGSHPRLVRLEKFPNAGEYLQGLMLKGPRKPGSSQWQWRGASSKPAHVEPLRLSDPDGLLVLFRTRLDVEGQLAIARVGPDYREIWRTLLPLDDLGSRWEVGGRLVLLGETGRDPQTGVHERLISLDPKDGSWAAWDLGKESLVSP